MAELLHGSRRSRVAVRGARMAFLEQGDGDPIVLLHGNPTSSRLWRRILPHLAPLGRCIAPDLPGFGHSDPLEPEAPERYAFAELRDRLEEFLDAVGARERVVLVLHDWGSVLGFDWARRHPERVAGIAYMEAVVRPVGWDDLPEDAVPLYRALRAGSPGAEALLTERNLYVEVALPGQVLRTLGDDERAAYRAPFEGGPARRSPILALCRQVPLDGTPADVHAAERAYADWLAASPIPKLFVNAEPGAFLVGAARESCRRWPAQEEVTVAGRHFLQEDSPDEIGRAVADWIARRVRPGSAA